MAQTNHDDDYLRELGVELFKKKLTVLLQRPVGKSTLKTNVERYLLNLSDPISKNSSSHSLGPIVHLAPQQSANSGSIARKYLGLSIVWSSLVTPIEILAIQKPRSNCFTKPSPTRNKLIYRDSSQRTGWLRPDLPGVGALGQGDPTAYSSDRNPRSY